MCDPVTIGLILSAAGSGAKAINTNQALKRQDRQAAEGIRRQSEIDRQSNNRVNEQIEGIAESTGAPERQQSLEGFINALRTSRESSEGSQPSVPGASDRFVEQLREGREGVRQTGTERAGRMSHINAPVFQRQREGADIRRTGVDLGEQQRRSSAEDFLTRLRVASERPNEFINALASVAQGAGSAMTLGAGGGANLTKLAKQGTLIDAPTTAFNSIPGMLG